MKSDLYDLNLYASDSLWACKFLKKTLWKFSSMLRICSPPSVRYRRVYFAEMTPKWLGLDF